MTRHKAEGGKTAPARARGKGKVTAADAGGMPAHDTAALQAIVEGRHGDPFAVLGPHEVGKATRLTVFVPGAEQVLVLTAGGEMPMAPVPGAEGVFVAGLAGRVAYRLRGKAAGHSWDFEDPYRFGPVLGAEDEYYLAEGSHRRLWRALGAHPIEHEGVKGVLFAVWAPNASRVAVVGDFNFWDDRRHGMRCRPGAGLWEIFVPGIGEGEVYKYAVRDSAGTLLPLKADPVGFGAEHPPRTGSVVRALPQPAPADDWTRDRGAAHAPGAPISIYEVHVGSWRRGEDNRHLRWDELSVDLVEHVHALGFTHIELMPISEHPFDGSWGYQPVGLYAPTVRHGSPADFRAFVAAAHARGIGVLLDWVPGHFPTDVHGLARFDGTPLYEHADPREGFHQDWNTLIYNFGRREVANFLVSNALYWLEEFAVDGLRVDAVASMLYRDYSRKDGEWIPNRDGGRENYEAIALLQQMNTVTYGEVPGIMTVAEESTAYPGVTGMVHDGGLGFGFKWNMGWMNDTLGYIRTDPLFRRYHHHQMTFGLHYAFSENFILPISHDEVVHGKGSMLAKMPGNDWEKFANLRSYYAFMWTHPGKKLLFMGQEFAQPAEWNHNQSLDWHLAGAEGHAGIMALVRDLNRLYRELPALHRYDCSPAGFQWLQATDADNSVYAYVRSGAGDEKAVVIVNFTPVQHDAYALGLPSGGLWREVLNTDAAHYGGGNRGNLGGITASDAPAMGQPFSASILLPTLAAIVLVSE